MTSQFIRGGFFGAVVLGCSLFLGVASEAREERAGSEKATLRAEKGEGSKARREERRRALDERLSKVRERVLGEQVGLNPARKALVEQTLMKFHGRKSEIGARLRHSQAEVRRLLQEDSQDQEAFRKLLSEVEKSTDALHSLRREEAGELARLMTPKEQAKFALALQRVQRQVRATFHRHHERSGDKPGKGSRSNQATDSK